MSHDAAHPGHAMSAEDVKKHVRVYVNVFVALAALTVVTVAVSYLHLNIVAAIAVAMFVACIKGALVACYFMHLIDERRIIYATLALCAVFFVALMMLPVATTQENVVVE